MSKPNYKELKERVKELEKFETEHKHLEETLKNRVELIELITIISTTFINLKPEETDEEITCSLELIGKFLDVDRSYIFLFSEDVTTMYNAHEWCSERIEPRIQDLKELSVNAFPWFMERIKILDIIYIHRIADLSFETSAEKEFFESQGVQSVIIVPMFCGSSLIGFLGFDSMRSDMIWKEENIALIKIVCGIFASALKCKWAHEKLIEHRDNLEETVKNRTVKLTKVDEQLQFEISERKKTEIELWESEERYRLLAENVTDVIWTTDLNLKFTYISSSIKRLLGYSVEETLTKTVEEILTSASFEIAVKTFKEELTMEEREQKDLFRSRTLELELNRKDGSTVWCEVKMTFLRDQDNNPSEILGVARDITERKKAAEALRDSEEKYRTLTENTNDIVFSLNAEGLVSYIGPQIARYGFKPEKVISQNFYNFIFPDDRSRVIRDFKKTVKTGEEFTTQFRIKDKKGNIYWLEDNGKVQRDESGRIIGRTGVLRDITRCKKKEKELNIAFGAIETSLNAIFLSDIEGIVTYANPEAADLWGFNNTKIMVGTNILDYWTKESQKKVKKMAKILLKKGSYTGEELIGKRKDGTEFFVKVKSAMIRDESGIPIGMVGSFYDFTEHKS